MMAQPTTSESRPRTEHERIAYEEGVADGKASQDSGIGIFSVFLACTIAILLFVDSPTEGFSELAGRLDRIENAIGGHGRVTRSIEQEAAALTPRHCHPDIAAEIRRAVREARGLPGEATILRFPTQNRNPE